MSGMGVGGLMVSCSCNGDTGIEASVEKLYEEGMTYFHEGNYTQAIACYQIAAEQGHMVAEFYLGHMYGEGLGVEQSDSQGFAWYLKSAEQGYAKSQYNVGFSYEHGQGVAANEAESQKWYKAAAVSYQKLAAAGDREAQYDLGCMYNEGEGVDKDPVKAVEWLEKAAQQGHVEAQYALGCIHDEEGEKQDKHQAFEWFERAAKQGHADAQYNVGYSYKYGKGVAANEAKSQEWYKAAASSYQKLVEAGDREALYDLGCMYNEGEGVDKDPVKAVEWLEEVAQQGHVEAQYVLGYMYGDSEGGIEDPVKAFGWFEKAAKQGHADAQYNVGYAYQYGEGVAANEAESEKWYKEAAASYLKLAEAGDMDAQYDLGCMYEDGRGVALDPNQMIEWIKKAAIQGHEEAKSKLKAYSQEPGVQATEMDKIPKLLHRSGSYSSFSSKKRTLMETKAVIMMYVVGREGEYSILYKYSNGLKRQQKPAMRVCHIRQCYRYLQHTKNPVAWCREAAELGGMIKFFNKPLERTLLDDELGFGVTGSKLRKYQSLLHYMKAQAMQQAILVGGAYSNNILGLSQLLIEHGVTPYLFLRGDAAPAYKGNFLLTSLLVPAEQIFWVKRSAWNEVEGRAQNFADQLSGPSIVIPEGACMVEALPGAMSLGADILRNEQEHSLLLDHIFIEAGTGLAAIGLILGFKIYRKTTQVHVVLLADDRQAFLKKLHHFYQHLVAKHQLQVTWEALIQGLHFYQPLTALSFGTTNRQVFDTIIQIARQDGILTDPIYSAKLLMTAKHYIVSSAMKGNILIIHSGGGLSLMGFQEQLASEIIS
eukprot:gene69-95_t